MSKKIVALYSPGGDRLIVWFEPGEIRELHMARLLEQEGWEAAREDPESLPDVSIMAGGAGLEAGEGLRIYADEVYGLSSEVDLIECEKQRLISDLTAARRAAGFSQTRLGAAAGIHQPVISRIESGDIAPQVNTLFKLLAPMGKTLAIVDLV